MSSALIRASRAMLKWWVAEPARASGLTPAIVRRLEESDGGATPRSEPSLRAIRAAVEAAGVELVFSAGEEPGVRPSDRMNHPTPQDTAA